MRKMEQEVLCKQSESEESDGSLRLKRSKNMKGMMRGKMRKKLKQNINRSNTNIAVVVVI